MMNGAADNKIQHSPLKKHIDLLLVLL